MCKRKKILKLEQEQIVAMADNQNQKVLLNYAMPNVNDAQPNIMRPTINANNFEIKPVLIQMVQQEQFGGEPTKDSHVHLANFLEMCETIKMNEVFFSRIKPMSSRIPKHLTLSPLGMTCHKIFWVSIFS